ncbi:MAG: hypothetical protein KGJ02_04180 [Verrucomicrobiota bacterium]|nr:hypothetical protein [Verrucomicrobiota bacterium]
MKFLFLFPLFCWAAPICIFQPPPEWQAAQPKNLSEHVQIGFVTKGSSSDFCPSINLATEAVDCSLKEYVKAVKGIHLSQPNTQWRDLGQLKTKGGAGQLTEITNPSPWGDILMLQAIVVKDKIAYILTAATLKKEFPARQKEILTALSSLQFTNDLWSMISDETARSQILSLYTGLGSDDKQEQDKQWKQLQDAIAKNTSSLGSHWQFLALKDGYVKIYKKGSPP